jgi:hypothetical protein
MTLAVAEGIVANPDDQLRNRRSLHRLICSRPKDDGATCSASITKARTKAAEDRGDVDRPSSCNGRQEHENVRAKRNRSGGTEHSSERFTRAIYRTKGGSAGSVGHRR